MVSPRRPGGALRLSFDQLLGGAAAAAGGGLHGLHGQQVRVAGADAYPSQASLHGWTIRHDPISLGCRPTLSGTGAQ